jgi:micrococcal nuclease
MGQRLLIAVIVASSCLVSGLEAGRPAPKPAAPHVSAPHPAPRMPAPHPNVPHPNAPHPNVQHPNVQHPNAAHPSPDHKIASGNGYSVNSLHKISMKGPQRIAGAMLRNELVKSSSKIQLRLHHHEHWHHWHPHAWVWGVYGFLPTSTSNVVTSVPSGNSLTVSGIPGTVRLAGVGAPIAGQALFSESRDSLDGLANGQTVRVFNVGTDFNGATVAQVFFENGAYLNEQQIRSGMAWNAADDGFDPSLASAEEVAQASGSGLWGGDYSAEY